MHRQAEGADDALPTKSHERSRLSLERRLPSSNRRRQAGSHRQHCLFLADAPLVLGRLLEIVDLTMKLECLRQRRWQPDLRRTGQRGESAGSDGGAHNPKSDRDDGGVGE